jgi:hypothetical protein
MKAGRTLTEVAAEIERQAASKRDFVADTRKVALLDDGNSLDINGVPEVFGVTPHAHRQIGSRLRIPADYYDRLRTELPALLATNVNTLFREKPETRMIRTLDGRARAFLSRRYRRLDNIDVAENLLPILSGRDDLRFESAELTERKLYIKLVSERIGGEVKVGDPVQAGLVISNSEIGLGAIDVAPLIYTLSCRNGAIMPAFGQKKYHVGRAAEDTDEAYEMYRDETLAADDRAYWLKVQDVVRSTLAQVTFDKILERLRVAADQTIKGDPVQTVELAARRFSLTDSERGSVLRHLIEGRELSAYGLLNAITRSAQDVESYDRATELETVASQVLELDAKAWREIAEPSQN